MKLRDLKLPLLFFVLYWPIVISGGWICHAMAWNGGPQGVGEQIFYTTIYTLIDFPFSFNEYILLSLFANCFFYSIVVYTLRSIWKKYTLSTKTKVP